MAIGVWYVDRFVDDPSSEYPRSSVRGYKNGSDRYMELASHWTSAQLARAYALSTSTNQFVVLSADRDGDQAGVTVFASAADQYVFINPKIRMSRLTSDPSTLSDSDLWYRSDLGKLRLRVGITVENLATESYALTSGDNITELDGTAYRLPIINGSGDVAELAHGTPGQVLTSNGASADPSWQDASGGGGMSLVVKTADETVNSSTTLQNDDDLFFAVGANEKWQAEGLIVYESGSTPDFKLTFTGPSGAVGSFYASNVFNNVVTGHGNVLGTSEEFDGRGQPAGLRFWVSIANGANAGNLQLQWSQVTSDAGDTTVYAGSYLKYQQVA